MCGAIFLDICAFVFAVSSLLYRISSVGADLHRTPVSACSCNNLFVPLNLHFQVLQWGHSTRLACHSGEPPGRKGTLRPWSHCMWVKTCQCFSSSMHLWFHSLYIPLNTWQFGRAMLDSAQQSFRCSQKIFADNLKTLVISQRALSTLRLAAPSLASLFIPSFQGYSRAINVEQKVIWMQMCTIIRLGCN